ncbi:MAG: thiamine-binding protein [Planctomycetota bacterium]|nr:MAG: thiamine-binding protein [Planctomycetota bacterium]
MVLLEFSMYPLDKGESLSRYVARSLDIIDQSGLDYQCHAMGTTLEGEFDQVMEVVRRCFERMSQDCNRIECIIKMDYRAGKAGRLHAKVASVEEKLGRPVKK